MHSAAVSREPSFALHMRSHTLTLAVCTLLTAGGNTHTHTTHGASDRRCLGIGIGIGIMAVLIADDCVSVVLDNCLCIFTRLATAEATGRSVHVPVFLGICGGTVHSDPYPSNRFYSRNTHTHIAIAYRTLACQLAHSCGGRRRCTLARLRMRRAGARAFRAVFNSNATAPRTSALLRNIVRYNRSSSVLGVNNTPLNQWFVLSLYTHRTRIFNLQHSVFRPPLCGCEPREFLVRVDEAFATATL